MAMLAYAEEMILRFPNAKAMIFIKWTKKSMITYYYSARWMLYGICLRFVP